MTHQDMQGNVLGHPHGEIGIDDSHHRHVGQLGIGEEIVGASAEREDRLEIGKSREQSGRRLPYTGIADAGGIADRIRPDSNVVLRRERAKALLPSLRVPAHDREENARHCTVSAGSCGARIAYWATTPTGAVSRLKAAANRARV
jgi:hypothetical protein